MEDNTTLYTKQLQKKQKEAAQLERQNNRLSMIRLFVFVAAVVVLISLFEWWWPAAAGGASVLFVVFLFLVKLHLRKEKTLLFVQREIAWYENELKYASFDFKGFYDGTDLEPEQHHYASDLDLFGPHSLFQYTNRAQTQFGREKFASYLLQSASIPEIEARQKATKELSEKSTFRRKFLCTLQGLKNDLLLQLKQWTLHQEGELPKWMPWYRYIFMALFWPALLAIPFVEVASSVAFYLFIINVFFLFRFASLFAKEHGAVSKTAELLQQLTGSLNCISEEDFDSELLQKIKTDISEQHRIAEKIKKLSSQIAYWDYRLNMIMYILLANLFVWDVWWMYRVQRWKRDNKVLINFALEKLAEMEALASMGTLHYNHPKWCFPTVNLQEPADFVQLGHPLLHPKQRVDNDFSFKNNEELVFVSGSNMAGKSTFLRSVGVNIVLAQMGAPVCAQRMRFRPVHLFSLMRIKDSIEENTSTFYFEIKRIKELLQTVEEHDNVLYLLDELLRGTNSHDKHHGTEALIEWLLPKKGLGFIASHDLGLAELEKEHKSFSNYHFDVRIDNNEMDFDYVLHPGPCKVFNAAVLLREIGIEIKK